MPDTSGGARGPPPNAHGSWSTGGGKQSHQPIRPPTQLEIATAHFFFLLKKSSTNLLVLMTKYLYTVSTARS